MVLISDDARRRRLARRHLLLPAERVDRVEDVADALVALHSSDPVSVHISAAMRLRNPSLDEIERALYEDRTLVRHHAMRRTLWVMPLDVARAAHDAFTRKIAAAERVRTTVLFGCDVETVDEAVERVVAVIDSADGPIRTRDLALALPDLATPIAVNQGTNYAGRMAMHTRALLLAAFEARIARGRPAGTWIASQYAWSPHGSWIAEPWSASGDGDSDQDRGAAFVIGRWLAGFGPGTLDDIVWWTGSTKTVVRRALDAIGAVQVDLEQGAGYVLPDDLDDVDESGTPEQGPWAALLPGLDPTAMGWKQRSWYLAPEIAARVVDRNGNIGPTVWADGRIVGGWVQRPDGSIAHDAELDDVRLRLLDAEIVRLQHFVGLTRFTVRFPSPNQRSLLT
jgi:hypothetical protein